MTRYMMIGAAILCSAGAASAQYMQPQYPYGGGGGPGGFGYSGGYSNVMPNVYSPQNQPLSPYLNLLRGGNAGVNYYYGVRPGTVGGFGSGGIGAPFTAAGGNRPLFFPQLASAPDPEQPREVGVGDVLPPAGHPVQFNNTGGYFPSGYGQRGGNRPGLAGVGTTRPPAKR